MPDDARRFALLLDEYIGFIGDLPGDAEFGGHFILEDKINAEGETLGLGPVFHRSEHWKSPDGAVAFTVPHNASDEEWGKIEKAYGDIEAKDYRCEILLTVYRPHRMGRTTYFDLPLRGFRNNENFPQKDRQQLVAMLREWQRAARTEADAKSAGIVEQPAPAMDVDKAAEAVTWEEAMKIIETHCTPLKALPSLKSLQGEVQRQTGRKCTLHKVRKAIKKSAKLRRLSNEKKEKRGADVAMTEAVMAATAQNVEPAPEDEAARDELREKCQRIEASAKFRHAFQDATNEERNRILAKPLDVLDQLIAEVEHDSDAHGLNQSPRVRGCARSR